MNSQDAKRRSRNRIVLVLVIEPRHPIEDEDENEDDEEKFARRAKIFCEIVVRIKRLTNRSNRPREEALPPFVLIRVHSWQT